MILKDLKLFKLLLSNDPELLFSTLSRKIKNFYPACPENTPLDYRGKNSNVYWYEHIYILEGLDFCVREIKFFQNLCILNTDNSIVKYDPKDSRFRNSYHLLLNFSYHLARGWRSILFMAGELKLNPLYLWGDLENQLVDFWINITKPMDEILKILHSWDKEITFPGFTTRSLYFGYFYSFRNETPDIIENIRFKKYIFGSKHFWIKTLIKWVFVYEEHLAALYASLRRKPNYKNRIHDLDREAIIDFVYREILLDIDIKTLWFLAGNGFINLNDLRRPIYKYISVF